MTASATHSRLLFRSYLFIALTLVLVAAALDIGFSYLQSKRQPENNHWLEATFNLIEAKLYAAPPTQWNDIAQRIASEIALDVQLLAPDQVVATTETGERIAALIDKTGNTWYFLRSKVLDRAIRIGPVEPPGENMLLRLLPPIFYLSILVVVGLWLRPLLRDLNVISRASQRFAADYREPFETATKTSELTGLAKNLDEMSSRLSGLIQSQKELTAALSHEMRTPLARIRFAIAVAGNNGSDTLKQQLDAMSGDVQEIDLLVATMLNYARLDHPDQQMHWEHTPVEPWIQQTLRKRIQSTDAIDIVTESTVESAWMDSRLMGIALSNLVVNACRYARSKVRVTIVEDDAGYRLRVEDDGDGISETERETVFKAFTRLDTSRNRDTGGYGLGLAIVARISGLHGGDACVDRSEEFRGASFTLVWPKPPTLRHTQHPRT